MLVKVDCHTKPLFGTWLASPARIHYVASFIVRDRHDFGQIYNLGAGARRMTHD